MPLPNRSQISGARNAGKQANCHAYFAPQVSVKKVMSAEEMYEACVAVFPATDIAVLRRCRRLQAYRKGRSEDQKERRKSHDWG